MDPKSLTGNMMTISTDMIPQMAESSSDGRNDQNETHTPVNILVSTVNRKILTNAWLQKGPISSFRRLASCGCPEE